MLNKIKKISSVLKSMHQEYLIQERAQSRGSHLLYELIRNIHSVEKGLSIANPRADFGKKKIEDIFLLLNKCEEKYCNLDFEEATMAYDALERYVQWHIDNGLFSDFVESVKARLECLSDKISHTSLCCGGTLHIEVNELKKEIDLEALKKIILSRHSVREFSDEPVNLEVLKEAIGLALHCPTACNRQGVRVYILDKSKKNLLDDWLEGTGGFDNEIDKFIFITGDRRAYRQTEPGQYIVSASILAGYLSITLHSYGFGACLIQRPVFSTAQGEKLKKKLGIDVAEQIICMMGVGNLKPEFNVPVSHRKDIDHMIRVV